MDNLGAYGERTGVALPLDKVKKARGRELDKINGHGVKKDITWAGAKAKGYKIVRSGWVDGFKPLPDDPEGVRSRCVAQEVNASNGSIRCSDQTERSIAVVPPDVNDGEHVWKLFKAMNSTREASKGWAEFVDSRRLPCSEEHSRIVVSRRVAGDRKLSRRQFPCRRTSIRSGQGR